MQRTGPTTIKRALALACVLTPALAGCGSGGSHPVESTITVKAGASGQSATTSTGSATASTTPSSTLKVTGTPRYGSPSASAPVQSGVVNIAYREITIRPDTLKVKVGTTVKWTNFDPVEHNVTSEGGPQHFASKNFGEGGTFAVKLTKPGTIHYECTIHPASMNGTIVVVQ